MEYLQTDNFFNEEINAEGCLFFSLMDITENHTGHSFIPKTINKLYNHLNDTTFVLYKKTYPLMSNTCYVNNHEKCIQEALEVFGCHDKVKYVGAEYNSFYTKRKSWGNKNGMYIIMQYKTANGNGHFRRIFYDPYKPDIKLVGLMSIRFYDIGI